MTGKKGKKINIRDQRPAEDIMPEGQDDETAGEEISPDPENDGIEKRLETKELELKDTYDRLLRISAEFENYKKRITRETDDFKRYANESLVSALLPIVDNLERAICACGENDSDQDPLLEGVCLTHTEILKVLEKFSVTPVDAVGLPFDPNYHEAVMQEPSEDHPDNTVVKELQKGYLMHTRLIRPAMVVVSKKG
jgi:molecular chaperone GrpE